VHTPIGRSQQRVLLVLALFLASLVIAVSASAQQPVGAQGEAVILTIFLNEKGWVLAFTYALSPAEIDKWLQAPSKIEERDEKLVVTINDQSMRGLSLT
jgi:hypothetical protein